MSESRGLSEFGETRGLEIWDALAQWRAEGRRFALLSVVRTRGFTPRKEAAHMLVAADGETRGTIGGGAIEREVVAEALRLLESGAASRLMERHLTQELGMCCGGEMSVFAEVVAAAPRFYLFGAGYIAQPLAALASGCGFRVTVVDERPEWANAGRFSGSEVVCRAPEDYLRALVTEASDYAVVVTHDHALDQRLIEGLLARPLAFVGMIGSVPKQRKFALRLRARGFAESDIARLRTPLGLPIGASTPEEIAVSAMAEIIAARRGVPVEERWTPGALRPPHAPSEEPSR